MFGRIIFFYVSVNKKTPNQFVLTNFKKTLTKFYKWCISNLEKSSKATVFELI